MEQGEGVDFKMLRAKFQNDEALRIRMKPSIPEKPKTLTSPTTKISNPLVASINSALENRTPISPRVVFKDEKKSPVKRQFSQSEILPLNVNDNHMNPELPNKKREGEIVKTLKNKNLPLVLPVSPVTPVIQGTTKPDPVSPSPVLASPVKVSTPKKKSIFSFRKSISIEKEKTNTLESAVPADPVHDSLVASGCRATPTFSEPVAPKTLPVQVKGVPVCSNPTPVIPAPVIPTPAISEPEVCMLTIPEPEIVSQTTPELEIAKPDIPNAHNLSVIAPQPEEVTHPSDIPDILDILIPPPIIPEDIPDANILALDIPAPVTADLSVPAVAASPTPVCSSPNLSRTASPAPACVTSEHSAALIPETVPTDSHAASDPRPSTVLPSPATDVEPVLENGMTESQEVDDLPENMPEVLSATSSKTVSPLSALARAEEMAPIRHNHCDQRVLKLLEKAKKKHATSHQAHTPTTPEIMALVETAPPAVNPPDVLTPEKAQTEAAQTEPIPPLDLSLVPEILDVPIPDIPPVDYEDQAVKEVSVESNTPTLEMGLTNGLDHSHASPIPKVLAERIPVKVKASPPPPPPRKYFPTVPNECIAPEKPPRVTSTDLQTSALLAQPVNDNGVIIPAPVDFTSENSELVDSEIDGSPDTDGLNSLQANTPEYGNSALSVHEQAFLEQLSPEHQSLEELVPNVDITETHFELSKTQAAELPDSVPDSLAIQSPTGSLEINYNSSDNAYEDIAVNKKVKTLKKQRKGAPMNPYADASVANEETSRKTLFAKKNPDEKELKKKEKQKEKEREKEKEKKEQKDKEKEKREQKDKEKEKEKREQKDKEKEKEKREQKDKEKEKEKKEQKDKEKEIKEKEKEKKEHRDKEREKREQKEKEREKKEQKEKEKMKNEMKKKFKITGEEEAMYQANVRETSKGRKNDLAVKAGETISIIRTTDCPKGKWLARDSSNKYGYISVESVELDIQEVMELGKRTKASNSNGFIDPEVASAGSRSSNHYLVHQESFTDDSEEWCDDDDTPFTPTDNTDLVLNHTASSLEVASVSSEQESPQQPHTDANDNIQARQEALQKLATFFAQPKMPGQATLNRNTIIEEPEPEEPHNTPKQDVDLQILPPPDLYADIVAGHSEGFYCS